MLLAGPFEGSAGRFDVSASRHIRWPEASEITMRKGLSLVIVASQPPLGNSAGFFTAELHVPAKKRPPEGGLS
jgi:hypothetical protein